MKYEYVTVRSIAVRLRSNPRRVAQAIADERVQPCGCGKGRYAFEEVEAAWRRWSAREVERQKEATLAVLELRKLAGVKGVNRWALDFLRPLLSGITPPL